MNFTGFISRRKENSQLKEARNRGCEWLLRQISADGQIGSYYKVLSALQACGHTRAASQTCNWILANEMTAEGDFGRTPRESKSDRAIYRNAWIIIGAQRLGRFELSYPGINFVAEFWDSESGGFYSSPLEREAETKQDLMVVGFCGLAALHTGRMDLAHGAARWLRTIMDAQPQFPQELYTVYSRARGLHVDPGPDGELRYLVSSDATRDQLFFQVGVGGAFLAQLYQATADRGCLALAQQYMRFAEVASDYLFRSVRAGKVGWAASLLHTITGEQRYREMALRVGNNLRARQARQGYWSGIDKAEPSVDITAEMIVWLDAIQQSIAN